MVRLELHIHTLSHVYDIQASQLENDTRKETIVLLSSAEMGTAGLLTSLMQYLKQTKPSM
jgi:hypothetical protein